MHVSCAAEMNCVLYTPAHPNTGASGVVVMVVVGDVEVVADVVMVVEGVVTSHPWNPPAAYASAILFMVDAAASHPSVSIRKSRKPHSMSVPQSLLV